MKKNDDTLAQSTCMETISVFTPLLKIHFYAHMTLEFCAFCFTTKNQNIIKTQIDSLLFCLPVHRLVGTHPTDGHDSRLDGSSECDREHDDETSDDSDSYDDDERL